MAGMSCPHCGVSTAYAPVEHSKIVQLSNPGNWYTVYLASGSIFDLESRFWFGLARCQQCDRAFPVRGRASTPENPDQTYYDDTVEPLWPTQYRTVPVEIPSPIREAMEDASVALGAGSVIGAMLAARTAMTRALRQTKKELDLPEASLKALFEAGRISRFEYEASDLARRWANYLGHEEPDPNKEISRDDAEEFYGYIEALLNSIYVNWERLNRQRDKLRGEEDA